MFLAVGTQLAWGGRDGIRVGWGGGRDAASRRSPPRFTIRVGRGNGTAKKDKTKRKRPKKTLDPQPLRPKKQKTKTKCHH